MARLVPFFGVLAIVLASCAGGGDASPVEVAVMGAGSWGTALAVHFADRRAVRVVNPPRGNALVSALILEPDPCHVAVLRPGASRLCRHNNATV